MASSKTWESLDERAQHLLRVLVDRYIREGSPVGSRTLSLDSGLDLSPATIRNIMADLEDLGFIESPHTSAGRVPTNKGYRFFVDTLVRFRPPTGQDIELVRERLSEAGGNPQALALSASSLLSAVTGLAGVVTVPRRAHMSLRQIEFLPLSGHRVLAIVVVNETEVQNKILSVRRDFAERELREAANYLTAQFRGRDLYEVRSQLLNELRETRESMNQLMTAAIELAQAIFPTAEPDAEFVMAGETNLMEVEELADVDKLRKLFEAFGQRRDILHLLDQSLNAEGVQIFIGHESGYKVLDAYSIVSAPYLADDDTMGVLGVIGPTRMAYERVIPIVDLTAKLLGRALKPKN
ncbi:MAG TPA: heat-inducible transcriptional repressor HrcA [Gammaproteobacteria bacterium]